MLRVFDNMTCSMNNNHLRQFEINDMNLQAANGRVPPSWGPEHEKTYPFRFYEADALLWCLASDADDIRKGPNLAQRLTGSAKLIVREIDPNILSVGAVVHDDQGNPVQLDGVRWLLRLLSRRYAPLAQEAQLFAVSEFFSFTRLGHEDTDQCIARFEVVAYRATHVGNANMNQVVLSWMLLHHLRIPKDRWPLILAQTNGNLPSDANEYQAFLLYLRRNGHLYDRTADPAKNVSGFLLYEQEPTEAHTYAMYPEYTPAFSQNVSESAYQVHEDWQSASSGNSNDEEPVDLSDIAHLPYPQAAEAAYMGFRIHKRRWRKFAGPRRKGGKKGQKGASRPMFAPHTKGKSKGKAFFGSDGIAYAPVVDSDWQEPSVFSPTAEYDQTYVMGKGKGGKRTSGNPIGRDGKRMLCSACDSPEHFVAQCPKGKGKGKGTFVTAETWPQTNSFSAQSSNTPSARGVYMAVEDTAAPAHDACTIVFADGSPAVQFDSSRQRTYFNDTASSSSVSTVPKQGFFPWWQINPTDNNNLKSDLTAKEHVQCYHSSVRLTLDREGLVVDTAAVTSLTGDHWVGRTKKLAERHGHGTSVTPLKHPFGIEGVGQGSNQVTKEAVVPIALATGTVGEYSARVVESSHIPALLGLEPLIKQRTLLDLHNGKMILLGEGGYTLKLSPGSAVHDLERAPTGHLMLPCAEWHKVKNTGKKIAFLQV